MNLWPQYTYLALCLIGLGATIADHGKPRSDENAYTSIVASGVVMWLLYMGGFFKGLL